MLLEMETPMRATKDLARREVEVYGRLLQERAVVRDITSEEVRGQQHYRVEIMDGKYDFPVECSGVVELGRLLSSMWAAYHKARLDLGVEDPVTV